MDVIANTAEKLDRPHVLIVDDDVALRDLTVELIELLGYSVTSAGGSSEAIARIKENPDKFDVVFTDYSLPVINGLELAKLVGEISPGIPIILCSGIIGLIDETQLAAAGIADVAKKPYSINELDSIIKRVVNRNGEAKL